MTTSEPAPAHPDLLAIERAAVGSWPAFETEAIDGWLARWASGGSVRANSVAALDWRGGDLAAAIARVVAFYRQRGAVPRFTVSEASTPDDLDQALARDGWRRGGEHVTMAKDIADARRASAAGQQVAPGPAADASRVAVQALAAPTEAWLAVYLQGLTPDRRPVAPRLVAGVPGPRRFFAAVRGGALIGSGMSVVDGSLASVQCMATLPEARRTGAATAVLAAIEAWAAAEGARRLYLQTDAENAAALGAYRRCGFIVAGHYHTRDLPA